MHTSEPVGRTAYLSRRTLLKGGLAAAAAALLRPGSLFPGRRRLDAPATGERPYLEVARRAERWIARSAIRTAHGTAWPVDPDDSESIKLDLY
ncbi:MAG: twin-arginine translocation signal domain-containing protein, partial [Gemmatimonadales bacterium]